MPTAISVTGLSKQFVLPHEKRDTLKESVLHFLRGRGLSRSGAAGRGAGTLGGRTYEKFNALEDVNLQVEKGDFIGIVGKNGSGKSTLLKIIAGIYQAGSGEVEVEGRVAPFLELGIGFQPELTARENIFINGTLLGMTRKEIVRKFDDIVAFAEVENFLDLKIKNFSSGMRARLAFAIAKEADADIYLCDEVLAVGDATFQGKCIEVFKKWHLDGKTIVLVTHDSGRVRELCNRAVVLESGRLVFDGGAAEAMDEYHSHLKGHL